MYGMVALHQA
ncbi:Protein of unknown function [Escherichia coli D6-113.11]|nr:Protein of unknown function [Escherichia coli D6-113.11]CDU35305.1 Protein of unknown function [Escherichia coli D6-113.11]